MILILRGHVRQSLENDNLYSFLKDIYDIVPFELYIHTWSIKQSSLSWRPMDEDSTPIIKETIYSYLRDLVHTVKMIMIDDDVACPIIGRTEGVVCSSTMSILGWKRYWYGQYHILDEMGHLLNNKEEPILNFRFDILNNTFSTSNEENLAFVKENQSATFTKNKFLKNCCFWGLDNFYMGNYTTMFALVKEIYFNLDKIEENYKLCESQEFLFFYRNEQIFYTIGADAAI